MAVKPALKLSISGTYSTSGVTLQEDLLALYPQSAIDTALKLKAKYKDKYTFSDEYYLDYARSLELQDLCGTHREIFKNIATGYEIQDPDWAGYSYEEIIEMENNGYKIPDEVLQWAHAQQQADVTSYVVITEDASTDDYSSTEEAKDDNSLDGIRQKAIKYITQADNSIKETEQQVQEFQKKVQKANEIKREQEDSFKDSMNEINGLTSEWKALDDKNKNGTLSKSEQKRYTELGKLLNGKDGKLMSNIQQDSAELDDFLTSLESLNSKLDNNFEVSEDVIQAGRELGQFSKNYNDNQSPHVNTGVVMKDTGLLVDVLFGVIGDEVANLAIEKGTDLETYSNDISSELKNGANVNLAGFADVYSTLAKQTQNNTKNTMGEAYDTSSDEMEQQNTQGEEAVKSTKEQTGYSVSTNLSYSNAIQASITTIKATVEMNSQKSKTTESDKAVKKSLSSTNKDMQKLNQEASATQQKREANMAQAEVFFAELESIQQGKETDSQDMTAETPVQSEQNVQPAENETSDNSQTTILFEDEEPQAQNTQSEGQDNNSDKVQGLKDQLAELGEQDQQDVSKLEAVLSKNITSNAKYQKNAKVLDERNAELEQRSKNVQKVSEDTMFVGTGTFALGVFDNAIGTSMMSTGIAMMSNPFTYNTGMILTILGRNLQNKGIKENISGTGAIVSSTAGLIASASADDNVLNSKATLKDYNALAKESAQLIKSVQQSIGGNNESTSAEGTADNSTETGSEASQNSADSQSLMQSESAMTDTQTSEGGLSVVLPEETTGEIPDEAAEISDNQQEQNVVVIGNSSENDNTQPQNNVQGQINSSEQAEIAEEISEDETQATAAEGTQVNQSEEAVQSEDTENSSTQETSETEQSQTAEQEQEPEAEDSSYSVSIAFGAVNAMNAASTTSKATQDMKNSQNEVDDNNNSVVAQVKKSADLVKSIEKESNKAQSLHEVNLLQAQNLTQEYETAQMQVQNAQTEDEASASQNQMQNIATQMETASSSEEQTAADVNKTVANGIQQLTLFKSSAQALGEDITSLDKKIANQLDVSKDTLVVGIGTSALGVINTAKGVTLITSGTTMMSNPFTFSAGVAQVAIGQLKLGQGILETATGTVATVSGANGLAANSDADNISKEAASSLKSANSTYKDSDKRVQDVTNAMADDTESDASSETSTTDNSQVENKDRQGEDDQVIASSEEDETALAASATTNVNINNSKMTDDKEDKRLARFNNDSIIESKKKKKKVMAVSSSARG